MTVLSKVKLKIKLGKLVLVQTFFVVQGLSRSVILRIEFLGKHKTTLDFGKRTLVIRKRFVLLKGKQSDEACAMAIVYWGKLYLQVVLDFVKISLNRM